MSRPKLNEFPSTDSRTYELLSKVVYEDYDWKRFAIDEGKYIDQLEKEWKDANQFIIDIANVLGIDADGVGFDGLQLSIDDFEEAKNKLEEEKKALIKYVQHEESCKCITDDVNESNCDCGLYELIKNNIRH